MKGTRDILRTEKLMKALSEGHTVTKAAEISGYTREYIYEIAESNQRIRDLIASVSSRNRWHGDMDAKKIIEECAEALRYIVAAGEPKEVIAASKVLLSHFGKPNTKKAPSPSAPEPSSAPQASVYISSEEAAKLLEG